MEITTQAIREIEKAIKVGTPDALGKALLRSYSLGRIELAKDLGEPVSQPLIDSIYESAYRNFSTNEKERVKFSRYVNIEDWIIKQKYFCMAQHGATQRDILLLQSYADKFLMTEKIALDKATDETLSIIKSYGVDAFLEAEPFEDKPKESEAKEITDRLLYSSAWLIAYNSLIDIMAETFGIPEYVIAKHNTEDCNELLTKAKNTFALAIDCINTNSLYSGSMKVDRITIIKTFCSFIDSNGLNRQPTAKAISKASKMVSDFSAFNDSNEVFFLLSPTIKETILVEKKQNE